MSETQTEINPIAILFAAITLTHPDDWSNSQHFSWEKDNINQAPAGPHYGSDVFSITAMTHKDGRVGRVCYDTLDYVYFDCGDIHWSGPLEDDVHAIATWEGNFEDALQARKDELAREQAHEAESVAPA